MKLVLTFSAVGLRLLLTWPLLEFHVAKVHDGSNYFVTAILLIRQEAKDVHGMLQRDREEEVSQIDLLDVLY